MSRISDLAEAIRAFPGVTRKNAIHQITDVFPTSSFPNVIAAAGEDAAVLECGTECILFATDGIMERLLESDPYLAGYFAVLVNVNDIAAMGGRTLGMVDVMSMREPELSEHLIKGIQDAIADFNVPIVGGHTHPDCSYNAIDIAIVGSVKKDAVLLSSSAMDGDDIVFVMDLDGHYPESVPLAYVTTIGKDRRIVQGQLEAVAVIAEKHLAHSCKDISNPGHLGTLGMLLETSSKGGYVDIDSIPIPDGVDEVLWAKTYQGCGFVFTCDPSCSRAIIELFEDVGCRGAVVGKVDSSRKLVIKDSDDSYVLFDFSKDIITGIKK